MNYQERKEYIDGLLKERKLPTETIIEKVIDFVDDCSRDLSFDTYIYLEKIYLLALGVDNLSLSKKLLYDFAKYFGSDKDKIKRLEAKFFRKLPEKENSGLTIYTNLLSKNPEDRESLKFYINHAASVMEPYNPVKVTEMWNDYLKIHSNDPEGWAELGKLYLENGNLNKALFCFEELLLHEPSNVDVMIKIAEILNSFGSADTSTQAIKYYAKALLEKEVPAVFMGIIYAVRIITDLKKDLPNGAEKLARISEIRLKQLYEKSKIKTGNVFKRD